MIKGVDGHVGEGLGRYVERIGGQAHLLNGIAGMAHRQRGTDSSGLDKRVVAQLIRIGQLGVEVGVAVGYVAGVGAVYIGVEVVDIGSGDAATVGQTQAGSFAELVLGIAIR